MKLGNLTISQRLTILTAVALAPALAILVYNEVALRDTRTVEINEQARRSGQLASLELERIVSGAEGTLVALSYAPVVQAFGIACSDYLRDVVSRLPQFTAIAVMDRAGVLRCRSEAVGIGQSYEDRPYFRQAVERGRFVVGEYTQSRVSGVATLPLALPLFDDENRILGVIVGGLNLDWLGDLLRERDFTRDSALTIADRNGVILAREPFPERFVGTRIPDDFRYLVTANEAGTMAVTSQDGTDRIIGYFPATTTPTGLYISSGISTDEAFAGIERATRRGLAVIALGAVIAFLTSWLIGRSLLRGPIGRLTETIAAWHAGDKSARIAMSPAGGEIAVLGGAIDQFLDGLEAEGKARADAEQHRDLLVGELDHRVKNLLSTVQAVATQTFKGAANPAEQLRAFSGRLAAMAAAHKILMSSDWTKASLRDVVDTAVSVFAGGDAGRFRISGENLTLKPKAALALSMALHELCTNAVKYGALRDEGGTITIAWAVEPDAQGDRFVFSWTEQDGPPVVAPTQTGFGSKMIERVMASEFEAVVDLAYRPSGLVCRIEGRADRAVGVGAHAPVERWKVPTLEPA